MPWTKEECELASESLKQSEISFQNAEKMKNSPTKNELLEYFATGIKRLQALIEKNCPPK
ncbi:hypothetical protein [Tunturiibacter gelidoferens]|jgi:hypothetical protein|uniref:Arsenate reductase-like glutaredoxin family protein n=1 Tax=Tunturiibacter gelidiferens TaxID=3069689 RepID=A0A9X0U2H1_9BACT|nr:hypothetical protein [Edaphobacter lichenicola]MBB5327278.1 arsenate reductase-like glutaredoxin family protein [Edaphobacter lichenicola]